MLCEIFQAPVHQIWVQFKVLLTPELQQDRQQVKQCVHQMQCLLFSSLIKSLKWKKKQCQIVMSPSSCYFVPQLGSQVQPEREKHSWKPTCSPLWQPLEGESKAVWRLVTTAWSAPTQSKMFRRVESLRLNLYRLLFLQAAQHSWDR